MPSIIVDETTGITSTEATVHGHIIKEPEENIIRVDVRFKEGSPDWEEGDPYHVICTSPLCGATFSQLLHVLVPESIYYFYFRANVSGNWITSSWHSFYTGPALAVTEPATNIGNIKGTLNGSAIIGEYEILERGFKWKKGESGEQHTENMGSGEGSFSKELSLNPNEVIYFRAYVHVSFGWYYGEWLYFTTTNILPTVTTQIATDIESISVTGNGTIVDGGGLETCLERGFEIDYEFSGNLEEYNAWVSHGFTGDIVYNSSTGKWEGTITKYVSEEGSYSEGVFSLVISNLVNNKTYNYRAKARNSVGWGYGGYLEFTTKMFLQRKSCTCGIFTIMLCAYTGGIPEGSVIKRRGFRWGIHNSAREYDIHEDGNFSASSILGPVDTISFVCSNDDNVYDTIVDSAGGFLSAGFVEGKFINVSARGEINPANEGQFKIISVTANTITVNVRNTLVSEAVTGVTITELFALYIVDLDPETDYYSAAYVAIEDGEGNWTVQEGNVVSTTTIANIFDFEGYDKIEFYKPERAQNYKKITRKIEAEVTAEQQYIEKAGGRRFLEIRNHLIQTKDNAVEIGTNYKERFKNIKSLMQIEYPTPAPLQREDTVDMGFGRIRFKEDNNGVVNFMPDGEGLMLFRYRMVMLIRKINMNQSISKEDINYIANMELEEA